MWVLSSVQSLSHVQLFATLWTVARQAPLSMGFSWQEYWSGLPCSPPGDLSDPGIKPASLASLTFSILTGGCFTTSMNCEAQVDSEWGYFRPEGGCLGEASLYP